MMDPNAVILIIEDDPKMRRFLRTLLESNDYQPLEAETGEEGIQRAAEHNPDLILLDVRLPDIRGEEVLSRLREWTHTPVVVVSGLDSEDSKVTILDAGADDYLTKPFGAQELLARIRVGLRHAEQVAPDDEDAVFENGELRVDRVARRVFMGENEIDLTPTEYRLLLTLVKNVGRVLTHRQILEEVWGPDCVGRDHYVRVYMAHLRRKLEEDPAQPEYIVTETGVGYRLRNI
ncbi:response regulator [Persicimonas caeni]|uniref:Response regulator n=2 Tax=Persicimonas caeni TaxID=2292766 RepID=A0A4Y6PPJ4_PERCE|nr:response regulator [Persicimonas caeni]QED31459.1 response regulator [Persicimonas caeni]